MKLRIAVFLLLCGGLVLAGYSYLRHKTITVAFRDMETLTLITDVSLKTTIDATTTPTENNLFEANILVNPFEDYSMVELTVYAPGYRPGSKQLAIPRWELNPLIELHLEPTQIQGQVVDAITDQPLVGVTVNGGLNHRQQMTSTNKAGQFSLTNLWVGDPLNLAPPLGYQSTSAITLTEFDLTTPITLRLQPTQITGQVVNFTGQPVANLTLSAGYGTRRQTITTDENGQFIFYRLVSDDIVIVQSSEHFPTEIQVGEQTYLTITVQPYELNLKLWNDYLDIPMADATINLANGVSTTADAQGQVLLSRIPTPSLITITQFGYHTITLTYQGEPTLNLSMIAGAVQGVVRDAETNEPIPQATIYIGDSVSRADDTGQFKLNATMEDNTPLIVKAAGYQLGHAQLNRTGIQQPVNLDHYNNLYQQWVEATPCNPSLPGPPCFEFKLNRFQAQAIYIPFLYLSDEAIMLNFLDFIEASDDLNAFIVDVKGDFGRIAWDSQVTMTTETKAEEWLGQSWMPLEELVAEAKQRNIYAIARFVIFKDDPLANQKPALAIRNDSGEVWVDGEELSWSNPFREEVWHYNISLAQEVAEFGFDEINFDYIRFPSDGQVNVITYTEENTLETRTTTIRQFTQQLTKALQPYPIFTSADVFGLTVWVTPETDMYIGQRVIDIAPHVDYLAPMVYPSTFIPGNLGYEDPSAEPYNIVYQSQLEAIQRVPPYVKVRPWLQAYGYNTAEMRLLRQGAVDANATGWAWWNAGGIYDDDLFGIE